MPWTQPSMLVFFHFHHSCQGSCLPDVKDVSPPKHYTSSLIPLLTSMLDSLQLSWLEDKERIRESEYLAGLNNDWAHCIWYFNHFPTLLSIMTALSSLLLRQTHTPRRSMRTQILFSFLFLPYLFPTFVTLPPPLKHGRPHPNTLNFYPPRMLKFFKLCTQH